MRILKTNYKTFRARRDFLRHFGHDSRFAKQILWKTAWHDEHWWVALSKGNITCSFSQISQINPFPLQICNNGDSLIMAFMAMYLLIIWINFLMTLPDKFLWYDVRMHREFFLWISALSHCWCLLNLVKNTYNLTQRNVVSHLNVAIVFEQRHHDMSWKNLS